MGNQSSKVVSRATSGASRRQFPSKPSTAVQSSASPSTTAPSHPPPTSNSNSATVRPPPSQSPPSPSRTEHIDLDARDPQFGSHLRRLGAAKEAPFPQPPRPPPHPSRTFPTSSRPPESQHAPSGMNIFPSASNNPALNIVHARDRIAKRWEEESEQMGRKGFAGRTLLGPKDVREVVRLREQGTLSDGEIERRFMLRQGILGEVLGRTDGVVGSVREEG